MPPSADPSARGKECVSPPYDWVVSSVHLQLSPQFPAPPPRHRNCGNKLSSVPKAAADLLGRPELLFRELEGVSVFEVIFFPCIRMEPAHSSSKIYSAEQRQKIGKA